MSEILTQWLASAQLRPEASLDEVVAAFESSGAWPHFDPSAVHLAFAEAETLTLRSACARLAPRFPGEATSRAFLALAADPEASVRREVARTLERHPTFPGGLFEEKTLALLFEDRDPEVLISALRAGIARPPRAELALEYGLAHAEWTVRQAVLQAAERSWLDARLPRLWEACAQERDEDVLRILLSAFDRALARGEAFPCGPGPAVEDLERIREARELIGPHQAPRFFAWLDEHLSEITRRKSLAEFGRDLCEEARAGRIPRGHGLERIGDTLLDLTGVRRTELDAERRAIALVGEAGTGKTAAVFELAHRLVAEDSEWVLLEVNPQDLLTGTKYMGEFETRIDRLVQIVKRPEKVVLYVPNLAELAFVGRSSSSEANAATFLAPHLQSGRIALIGESSLESFRRGLGADPSLRRLFTEVEMQTADLDMSRDIVEAVAEEYGAEPTPAQVNRLMELADFYLAGVAQPGRSVGLLRLVMERRKEKATLDEAEILDVLSRTTGMPVTLLDDRLPLDVAEVRRFFEERVLGQRRATDTVTDLVALIKAGLNDPDRPYAVMLFVGPTGVGKTELARALAEYIFGDASRLTRFDMSEYASYEAYERLIGVAGRPGLLTAAVREKPFSVILLDEIEKAHPNVFDLGLQIFDAGRLTDGAGRTVDFRRTVVVMTSNVGSDKIGQGSLVFDPGAADRQAQAGLRRELQRFFRPEFLNRIDELVVFEPLAEEVAERIVRLELDRVLERSGIVRRRLTVEVEAAVPALLLREGYSRTFGARPLKRTVQRMVLQPLARALAASRVTVEGHLKLEVRGGRIGVRVVNSGAEPSPVAAAPREVRERLEHLTIRARELAAGEEALVRRRSEALKASGEAGFWDDEDRARSVLDEIKVVDDLLSAAEIFQRGVEGLQDELLRPPPDPRAERERRLRLEAGESEAARLGFLFGTDDRKALGDAIVRVRRIDARGSDLDGVRRIGRMYQRFLSRRRFEVLLFDDRRGGEPREDVVAFAVSGAGSYATLAGESGLHILRRELQGADRGDRERLRVEVFALPSQLPSRREFGFESRKLQGVEGRLGERPKREYRLVHRPSMRSELAWAPCSEDACREALSALLVARLEASDEGTEAPDQIVRNYDLGPSPLVRDRATGRKSGQLERLLEGHLEPYLDFGS
jgi:ATP-dependent Clp protease ATP-binding subunit ClpC